MESRIVVVNGPAGVGKSTVSRMLAERIGTGVWVHGDALRAFVTARADEVSPRGLTCSAAGALAANLVAAGHALVAVDFIFEHGEDVCRFLEACSAPVPIHLFTLWATLKTVEQRELGRPEHDRLGECVHACYRALQANLAQLGQTVDTEGLSAEAVVDEILARCRAEQGRIDQSSSEPSP